MKRPLAVVGLSMLTVMAVVSFIDSLRFTVCVCVASFILLVITLLITKSRRSAVLPTVLMSAIAGCLLLLFVTLFNYLPVVNSVAQKAQVVAKALEYPVYSFENGRYYCISELKSIDEKESYGKVRLSLPGTQSWLECEADSIEPGDIVTFEGTCYVIAKDYESVHKNYKSKGVYVGAYPTGNVCITKGSYGVRHFVLTIRQYAIKQIRRSFSERTAGVLISVLTGDKSYLDSEIYDSFKMSGVAHIMAVSGLHLSVWIFLIIDIVERRNKNIRKYIPFLMCVVVLIMAFALFSGSIMRAGFMMLLYLSGFLFRRGSDALNSLGFASVVALLINPFMCMNISFLMSVVSTFSIVVFALPVSKILSDRLLKKVNDESFSSLLSTVISCVSISFFAQLSTLPIQIAVFGGVSLVGIVTNVLLLPVVMPLLVCAGLFCLLSFVPIVSDMIRYIAIYIVGYCVKTVNMMADLKFSYAQISAEVAPAATFCVILFLIGFYFLLQKQKMMLTKRLQ